jgi:tetratricopeptide (TPR) repeat protein
MAQITLRDYLQETEDAISSGRSDDALERCQVLLDHFPELLEAQRLLGEAYLAQNRLDEAQRAFDWVLTNDPENVITYCDRALVCERHSDFDTALDCYQQAYELSRGNSKIRNEFNKISAKANLPGFMFSRAGLARLYMRGALLTQSILEWEVVLSQQSDRLDARTGIIEAYWRDGQYDLVEQVARQLLQDVPGCVKALLLLAHVVSLKSIQQARELVRQAEQYDPDLLMAQELFSDLLSSRQAEPFLHLLKKPPVTLDSTSQNGASPSAPYQAEQAVDIPIWTSDSMPGFDTSTTSGALASPEDAPTSIMNSQELLTAAQFGAPSEPEKLEPAFSSKDLAGVELWENAEGEQPAAETYNFENTWKAQEDKMPAAPSWLNMLNQDERTQINTPLPEPVSPPKEDKREAPAAPTKRVASEPAEDVAFPALDDDDEASSFGPAWLKALGATTMEDGASGEMPAWNAEKQDVPGWDAAEQQTAQPDWMAQLQQTGSQEKLSHEADLAYSEFQAPVPHEGQPYQPAAQEEVPAFMASLNDLENSLKAQGFVELSPHSLAEIAKANHIEQESQPAAFEDESRLSDALAQFGNVAPQGELSQPDSYQGGYSVSEDLSQAEYPAPSVSYQNNYAAPAASAQSNYPASPGPMEMPEWVSLLEQTSKTAPVQKNFTASQETPTAPQPKISAPRTNPVYVPPAEIPAASVRREQPVHSAAGPVFEPSTVPPTPEGSISASLTAQRGNPFLENELETTMRRPAIRLEQLQTRLTGQRQSQASRKPAAERQLAARSAGGQISNSDRLLKGYQGQLAGDYDEAMVEYRLVIKNAPELLGEVISNLRALLKLAPKYVAGYRVLGDAYMKQGEYLQAMEAYNKALTMAKRGK